MNYKVDWPNRGHGYTENEIMAVAEVMRSKKESLTQGSRVKKFEDDFASYIGTNDCYATMSCAHALDISAMLIKLRRGDEVIIPSHTYCASAISFARRGAVIKWGDIDPNSLTMSMESILKNVTKNTKAIVLVHLYGLISPEVEKIADYAKENGIILIEDCAQALGASFNQKKCGTFGDIACFSFHAQKNLTTLGEGGMIYVKDPLLSKLVPGLRLNGHAQFSDKKEYWLPAMTNVDQDIEGVWPIKSTMTEVQATVGSLLLKRLDALTLQRRERGMHFREAMSDISELKFQEVHDELSHSHHLLPAYYQAKNSNRDDLIRMLSSEYGIKAIVQYYPLHRYDLFKKMGYGNAAVPNTDIFFDNMLSFPFSIEMSDGDFEYLIISIRNAIKKLRVK